MSAHYPPISIVIPVHYGGEKFRQCLMSIMEMSPKPMEVIVVADGDTDGSWRIAEELGMRVLRLPVPGGPARARNAGAAAAEGEILYFVDADVMTPRDALEQIARAFGNNPELAAVFGSYDDEPSETNFLSQYKNLSHHYVHQTSLEEASTFWGACGAIRRDIFLAIGGFDERYRQPAIEDIELGYRLKWAGYRIRLLKGLRVKHLKHWDALSLIKTDFFCRAVPWTELILDDGRFINDLNLSASNRMSVFLINLVILMLMGAPLSPWFFVPSVAGMIGLLYLNRGLYRFFREKRGLIFAAKTIPWHWFHFFYSGVAFALGVVRRQLEKLGLIRRNALKSQERFTGEEISATVHNE
jgi:GT2 family glycosyltransferase